MPDSLLNKRLSAGMAVAITLAVLVFFFAVFRPAYETNDDGLMNYIAAGSLTGKPSEFTLFSDFLFSGMLSLLYQATLCINWYALIFYLAQVLSVFSILAVLRKRDARLGDLFVFWI